MKDVTARLMGDPQVRSVREPTPQERENANRPELSRRFEHEEIGTVEVECAVCQRAQFAR